MVHQPVTGKLVQLAPIERQWDCKIPEKYVSESSATEIGTFGTFETATAAVKQP
jgi:hypothetical protein